MALILVSTYTFAQNSKQNKLIFKSISTGFGICAGKENMEGGLDFYIDATTALRKNLFSLSFMAGEEFNFDLFDPSPKHRDFKEYGILYGRELKISKIIKLETHTGVSIFKENYANESTNYVHKSETVIGIPIKIKILFYPLSHFALGLNPNINFNSIETTYSGNIIIQYSFPKNK